jgi:hypothetical protein
MGPNIFFTRAYHWILSLGTRLPLNQAKLIPSSYFVVTASLILSSHWRPLPTSGLGFWRIYTICFLHFCAFFMLALHPDCIILLDVFTVKLFGKGHINYEVPCYEDYSISLLLPLPWSKYTSRFLAMRTSFPLDRYEYFKLHIHDETMVLNVCNIVHFSPSAYSLTRSVNNKEFSCSIKMENVFVS